MKFTQRILKELKFTKDLIYSIGHNQSIIEASEKQSDILFQEAISNKYGNNLTIFNSKITEYLGKKDLYSSQSFPFSIINNQKNKGGKHENQR